MPTKRFTWLACCLVASACLVTSPVFAGKGQNRSSGNGDLQQWWQELPQSDRQMLHDRHEIFKSLPPGKQQHLQQRWRNYRELPPEERRKMHKNFSTGR